MVDRMPPRDPARRRTAPARNAAGAETGAARERCTNRAGNGAGMGGPGARAVPSLTCWGHAEPDRPVGCVAPGTFVRARRGRPARALPRRVGSGRSVVGAAHGVGPVGGRPPRGGRRTGGRARDSGASQARARRRDARRPGPVGMGRGMVRVHRPPRLRRRGASVAAVLPSRAPVDAGPVGGAGHRVRRRAGGGVQRVGLRGRRPPRRRWPDARPATKPWAVGPRGSCAWRPPRSHR